MSCEKTISVPHLEDDEVVQGKPITVCPSADDMSSLTDFNSSIKNASAEIRMGFVRKVYGILTVQLLLTVVIAAPIATATKGWLASHSWLFGLSIGMTFVTIIAMACCGEVARRYPQNYILLFTFTAFEGVMVGYFSAGYTWQSVVLAAGLTVFIFAAMTVYAWRTKTDFTGFGPYLFAFLLTFCMFGFGMVLLASFGVPIHGAMMMYDFVGVMLFTFYIVYDTQMILGEWGGHKVEFGVDDYVFAALNLYLDIINLFIYILSLLGDRQ